MADKASDRRRARDRRSHDGNAITIESMLNIAAFTAAALVAGCSAPIEASRREAQPAFWPATDELFQPEHVRPGRLEYAPDREPFAPLLTERAAYPTQAQANGAYRRLLEEQAGREAGSTKRTGTAFAAQSEHPLTFPSSVRLFGCKPGALDSQTARIPSATGPVVHCAMDFLDADGRIACRETVNFTYYRHAWRMQITDPPRSIAPWRTRERSPADRWWWVPGRGRYE